MHLRHRRRGARQAQRPQYRQVLARAHAPLAGPVVLGRIHANVRARDEAPAAAEVVRSPDVRKARAVLIDLDRGAPDAIRASGQAVRRILLVERTISRHAQPSTFSRTAKAWGEQRRRRCPQRPPHGAPCQLKPASRLERVETDASSLCQEIEWLQKPNFSPPLPFLNQT